jgi:serine/threonine-protein kinase
LLKAMLRTLAAEKGQPVAETWLRGIRMVRDDLEDETRVVPLSALHRALAAFAEATTREAIPRLWRHLVAPDNLGIWVRVLRGTSSPAEAFARLDAADSEYARSTRWETLATRRGWWRGRVNIAHDPALEEDGLIALARLAELTAVPALFGYEDARAAGIPPAEPRTAAFSQEFEVHWRVPTRA